MPGMSGQRAYPEPDQKYGYAILRLPKALWNGIINYKRFSRQKSTVMMQPRSAVQNNLFKLEAQPSQTTVLKAERL